MFKRGDIVTASAWKDQEPTMLNTAMVTRAAKDEKMDGYRQYLRQKENKEPY